MEDYISIADLSAGEFGSLIDGAAEVKAAQAAGRCGKPLESKVVTLFFEKASLRTRLSFEAAAMRLGAGTIFVGPDAGRLGERESIHDMAKNSERFCDALVLRTYSHEAIVEMAEHASIPVINALSDRLHPCQALADMLTIRESVGALRGVRIAYVGDANNVARSLAHACAKTGALLTLASPPGYGLEDGFVERLGAAGAGGAVTQVSDPAEAVRGAQVIYTDTWTSMGQEAEHEKRLAAFRGYRVDAELVEASGGEPVIMHCMPAHRGEEITDEVMDSGRSVVFDQAENRMHASSALLLALIAHG